MEGCTENAPSNCPGSSSSSSRSSGWVRICNSWMTMSVPSWVIEASCGAFGPPAQFTVTPQSKPRNILCNFAFNMVKELTYNTISNVIESWEELKRMKNYEETAGTKLFQRYVIMCDKKFSGPTSEFRPYRLCSCSLMVQQPLRQISRCQGSFWVSH